VVYPPNDGSQALPGERPTVWTDSGYSIASRDSTFVFGSTGRGDARLTINGHEIPVFASGGWIAWLPLPADSVVRFDIVAVAGVDTAGMELIAPLHRGEPVPEAGVWLDTTSFSPRGDLWIRAGEGLTLSVRAVPGAQVRGDLGNGEYIDFVEDPKPDPLPWGVRAFGAEHSGRMSERAERDRYVAWWPEAIGPDPGFILDPDTVGPAQDTAWMRVEAVLDGDTAIAVWPLRVGVLDRSWPAVIAVNDDPDGSGSTDGMLPGRPMPQGTYHWFFPNGTVARVSGRANEQLRLQLSQTSVAWVNAAEVTALPRGTPPPRGRVGSMRIESASGSVTLRIPLPTHIPYRVEEDTRALHITLYGVGADANWIHY